MTSPHFDQNGEPINEGSMRIQIVGFAGFGVLWEGKILDRPNGPHTVPRWFGVELVLSGRAQEVTE